LLKGIKYHNPNPEYPVITTSIFLSHTQYNKHRVTKHNMTINKLV
jgi:hypothetical protein